VSAATVVTGCGTMSLLQRIGSPMNIIRYHGKCSGWLFVLLKLGIAISMTTGKRAKRNILTKPVMAPASSLRKYLRLRPWLNGLDHVHFAQFSALNVPMNAIVVILLNGANVSCKGA
jgi:hypothetical protein